MKNYKIMNVWISWYDWLIILKYFITQPFHKLVWCNVSLSTSNFLYVCLQCSLAAAWSLLMSCGESIMIPLTLYFIGWWDQMQKSLHFEIWSEIQWFQHRWKLAKGFWIIKLWLLWEAHWSQQWAREISSQEQQEASSSQACHSISSKENWSLCKSTVSFLLLVLQRHILVHIFMINFLFFFSYV